MLVNRSMMRIPVLLVFTVTVFCAVAAQESTAKADVILQLFQWPWNDVAKLCTEVLSLRKGIGAVQVSPPQPHRIINRPLRKREVQRPWWERYQPTSLTLGQTRGGTADEFRTMVTTCNSFGIEIYSEVVINHLLAADAGLGRSTDGRWFSVDEKDYSLRVDDVIQPGILGKETEKCLDLTGFLSEPCYEPPYTLEGDACKLLKLNLTSAEVQIEIKAFLQSLLDAGVTGFSVSSASISTASEIHAIFWRLMYSEVGVQAVTPQPTIYLELTDKSQYEDELLLEYTSNGAPNAPDILVFSYGSASKIVELLNLGAAVPNEDFSVALGIQIIYFDLSGYSDPPRIAAFEHHEQVHGRETSNPFASLARLSPSQRTIATLLLLLSHPNQAGRPRLLWDYQADSGMEWQGPPSSPDFLVATPFDSGFMSSHAASHWTEMESWNWIWQAAEWRWKWFFERRSSSGFNWAERTANYELRPRLFQLPSSAVLAYVIPIDVINLPIVGYTPGQCKVGIIILSVHRNGTDFNGDEPQLTPGSYVLDEFGSGAEGSFLPLTDQRICGSEKIVTDYVWAESDCIQLRRTEPTEEIPEERTEVVLPSIGNVQPHFVVFEAEILSDWICSTPEGL